MGKIEVNTKVESDEYVKLMIEQTHKKPVMLIMSFIGVVTLIFGLTNITGLLNTTEDSPIFGLSFGVFATIIPPYITYRSNKKSYNLNSRLQEDITYIFEPQQMNVQGESFN